MKSDPKKRKERIQQSLLQLLSAINEIKDIVKLSIIGLCYRYCPAI